MAIDEDLLDRLLEGREPLELFARDGVLDDLKTALSERMPRRPSGTSTSGRSATSQGRPAGRTGAMARRPRRC